MEFGDFIQEGIDAYQTGAWVVLSVLILQALIKGLKYVKGAWEPIKPFAKPVILVASTVVGVLSSVVGGLSWVEALLVFAANGLSPFLHDLFHHFGALEHDEDKLKSKR